MLQRPVDLPQDVVVAGERATCEALGPVSDTRDAVVVDVQAELATCLGELGSDRRLARSTAELVQLLEEIIAELQRDLTEARAELRSVRAAAMGARYLAGAALGD